MKIVVIGGSRYIKSETVERLRLSGHDVVAAPQRSVALVAAPRDPGYAGRPLREFLGHIAFVLRAAWVGRHNLLGRLQRRFDRQTLRKHPNREDRIR